MKARFFLPPLLALLLYPSTSLPVEYEVDIIIEDEDDIQELYLNGDISEESKEKLLELFHSRLELNTAGREALYDLPGITLPMADAIIRFREKVRRFRSVKDLLKIEEIPQDVYIQMAPFVTVKAPPKKWKFKLPPVSGSMRFKGLDGLNDEYPPEGYFRLRAESGRYNAGIMALSRERLFGVHYDESMGVLVADDEGSGFEVPKAYLYYEGKRAEWIIGTYRIGFGQRLIFDNTSKDIPHGWYYDDLIYESSYETSHPKFTPYKKLLGASFRMNRLDAGSGWFDITGFLSYHPWLDIYQYDMQYYGFDAGYGCDDSDEPPCSDLFDPEGNKLSYEKIPSAYTEALGGGNITYRFSKRSHIGVTGYGAHVEWNLDAPDPEFKNSPIPNRPTFGAFGVDGAYGWSWTNLYSEIAFTDSGGWGGILRGIFGKKDFEVDTSLRNYTTDFDNPHSRGISQPDEVDYDYYEGYWQYYEEAYWTHADRDRDEQGYQLKVTCRPAKGLKLRAKYDIWRHPSSDIWDLEAFGRVDYSPVKKVTFTTYYRYRDNDLAEGDRDEDYSEKGSKHYIAGQVKTSYIPLATLYLFYKHYWVDSTYSDEEFQQDYYTYLKGTVKPFTGNTITARIKFFDENIDSLSTGERYLESYLQVYQKFGKKYKLGVRYTLTLDLEEDADPDEIYQHIITVLLEGRY